MISITIIHQKIIIIDNCVFGVISLRYVNSPKSHTIQYALIRINYSFSLYDTYVNTILCDIYNNNSNKFCY